jgi:release factor glutamine methyltransferase
MERNAVLKTVDSALQWAREVLQQSGVPEPSLNAEYLLAHALGVERLRLGLDRDRTLTDPEFSALRDLLERRRAREPLQYILGTAEFMGMVLEVNPHVLIPRPETETLVEKGLEFLRRSSVTQPEILDVGTGSGNIALSFKARLPEAKVTAMDISGGALDLAARNAARNEIDGVEFVRSDLFADFLPGRRFTMIVSNPPYVSLDEMETLDPEIRLFEPSLATTDNGDGFRIIYHLLRVAPVHLRIGGCIFIELGYGQAEKVMAYAARCGLTAIEVHDDLAGVPRVLQATFHGEA